MLSPQNRPTTPPRMEFCQLDGRNVAGECDGRRPAVVPVKKKRLIRPSPWLVPWATGSWPAATTDEARRAPGTPIERRRGSAGPRIDEVAGAISRVPLLPSRYTARGRRLVTPSPVFAMAPHRSACRVTAVDERDGRDVGHHMVTFILLNSGAALVAILIAIATHDGARASTVLFAALCAYLIVVHSVVLVCGLVGWLTVPAVSVALAAALAGSIWLIRDGKPERERERTGRAPLTGGSAYLLLAAVVAGAVWTWPHLTDATRLWIWDDYTYHMIYPALWLREHAIAAVVPPHAFTMQAWYPLSASVVAAWFMLPFHGARGEELAWVSLTGPLYAGIFAGGMATLLARVGCRPGAWALAVVLFATSHRIAVMASSFSDADLAQAAALFAAFVFALPPPGIETSRDVRRDAVYAGLLTGIALGVKVSAAAPASIILIMAALRAGRLAVTPFGRARATAGVGAIFALAWAVTGGYWFARNIVHTGNPLYPAAFLIWPGSRFPGTTLLEYSRQYGLRRTVADALHVYLNWPLFHAVVAVVGLLGLALWLGWRRRAVTRPQMYFAVGTLSIAAAVVLLLPATPFSAGNIMTFRAGFVHWDSMRYVALLPIFGWVALAFLIDAGTGASPFTLGAAVIIASAALLVSTESPRSSVLLVVLALGANILGQARLRAPRWPFRSVRARVLGGVTVALMLAIAMLWRHDGKARATAEAIYRERFFGEAVAALDRQPPGTRVAMFGDQWVFPTFGARDHLVPVRLDANGRLASALIADRMMQSDVLVDPATFISNLRSACIGVAIVLYLPHPGRPPQWPTQEAALEASPSARLLYRGEAVAVWAVDGRRDAAPPGS